MPKIEKKLEFVRVEPHYAWTPADQTTGSSNLQHFTYIFKNIYTQKCIFFAYFRIT